MAKKVHVDPFGLKQGPWLGFGEAIRGGAGVDMAPLKHFRSVCQIEQFGKLALFGDSCFSATGHKWTNLSQPAELARSGRNLPNWTVNAGGAAVSLTRDVERAVQAVDAPAGF